MLYFVQLPLTWLSVQVIFLALVCLWLFRLLPSFFVVFLVLFAACSWWVDWSLEHLIFGCLFPRFPQFGEFFLHVSFVQIDRQLGIAVGYVGIGRVGDDDHDIVDIRNLDSPALNADLRAVNELIENLHVLDLQRVVDEFCMILKRKRLARLLQFGFLDILLLQLSSLFDFFVDLQLSCV